MLPAGVPSTGRKKTPGREDSDSFEKLNPPLAEFTKSLFSIGDIGESITTLQIPWWIGILKAFRQCKYRCFQLLIAIVLWIV